MPDAPALADLLVEQIRATSTARAERDGWRTLAQQAIHYAAELSRENAMISARAYVHRRHAAEQRPDEIRRRQEAA